MPPLASQANHENGLETEHVELLRFDRRNPEDYTPTPARHRRRRSRHLDGLWSLQIDIYLFLPTLSHLQDLHHSLVTLFGVFFFPPEL